LATHLKSYLDSLTNWKIASARSRPNAAKKINLALQGGGAHGAFTWGVLDHLLGDGRLEIAGISGASAGAINAVMVADGLARGGAEEARKRLADFWRAASAGGDLPPLQRAAADRLFTLPPFATGPIRNWFEAMSHYFSPYELNPLDINPLNDLIARFVDFDAVRHHRPCRGIRGGMGLIRHSGARIFARTRNPDAPTLVLDSGSTRRRVSRNDGGLPPCASHRPNMP
jgi:NTE family protein